jgi:mevalonate pyrophosphate decarboxylase
MNSFYTNLSDFEKRALQRDAMKRFMPKIDFSKIRKNQLKEYLKYHKSVLKLPVTNITKKEMVSIISMIL